MSAPTLLATPAERRLSRELGAIRAEVEALKAGGRSTQMDYSSIMGPLYVRDPVTGDLLGSIGTQPDGGVATIPVGGPPPPGITDPILTPIIHGVDAAWNGQFAGGVARPTNFAFVAVHASQVGANFITDPSNMVGTLTDAGSIPVIAANAGPVWVRFVGYSTSTPPVTGPASGTVSATPDMVVAESVLAGIVDTVALADQAVTGLKVKTGGIGTAQLAGQSVTLAQLANGSVDATKLIADAVTSPAIAPSAVTTSELAANSVIAGKVLASSITATELAANSVGADQLIAGSVQAGALAANSVTASAIQALAITAGKLAVNAVTAGTIAAGAVTAAKLEAVLAIASRFIAGSAGGTRAEMNSGGFEAWSGSLQTFDVNAANGDVMMLGTYKSASTGQDRVEIIRDGTMDFYTGNTLVGRIESVSGGLNFRGQGSSSSSVTSRMFLTNAAASITFGNNSGNQPGAMSVSSGGTQQWGRFVGMRYMAEYAGDGTTPRVFMVAVNSSGSDVSALHVQKRTTDNFSALTSPTSDSGIAFVNEGGVGPEVYVVNFGANAYRPIRASGFPVGSSETTKQDIDEIEFASGRTSWDLIEGAPALDWRYIDEAPTETQPVHADGSPVMMRKRNPNMRDATFRNLPDDDPSKWVWEPAPAVTSGARHIRHRFPLAEDLAALDPDMVREGVGGVSDLAVDLRDLVGVHHDAIDMLIKRSRMVERKLLAILPGLRLPDRPQRGDVVEGVGAKIAGRTRRVLDADTGVARRRVRGAIGAGPRNSAAGVSTAAPVPMGEPLAGTGSGQFYEDADGTLYYQSSTGDRRKVA